MHPETVIPPVPAFINVQVTALPSGKPGKYTITCLTDPVLVSGATILNFQLIPGTPADVVALLNKEINKVIDKPAVTEAWAKQGAVPMHMSVAEFDAEFAVNVRGPLLQAAALLPLLSASETRRFLGF